MMNNRMYLVIDENKKVRKFNSIERMERYMKRQNGIYFVIDILTDFLGIAIVKSENGNLEIKKALRIERYR